MTPRNPQTLTGRTFLLLQGPQSGFFRVLAEKLVRAGAAVHKVHFCGGDAALWGLKKAYWYTGDLYRWIGWVGNLYRKLAVTDVCVYGDWRPLHWEAVRLAKIHGIRIWVFEEGYLRSRFSTLEEGGVNGRSSLPKSPAAIHALARNLTERTTAGITNTMPGKVWRAVLHHTGNVLLWPVFHRYRTHRPMTIGHELLGILPRYLTRKSRWARDAQTLAAFNEVSSPYYFFPLQLNTDSQIQLYSPYVRMTEAIADVMTSFAEKAPAASRLLIKNHPLDNGFIQYGRFIAAMAAELGVAERVTFVESGVTADLMAKCRAVVVVNSTVGLAALELGKPVYCLGNAVYNLVGLTASRPFCELDDFWAAPAAPDASLFADFKKVVETYASVRGNFYSPRGMLAAAADAAERFAGEPREEDAR